MISRGMKISELIENLQDMKAIYGDVEVFSSGHDYPKGVSSIRHVSNDKFMTHYVSANSIIIY